MKVITLIQPWGTLIAIGEKKIETRNWKTDYRGPLLIHAGKKVNICSSKGVFKKVLEQQGYTKETLPTGLIIAKCNLVDCVKIVQAGVIYGSLSNGMEVSGNEYQFGDYQVGRYAWLLENIEPIIPPIPAKGKQRLWDYQIE